MAKRKLTSLRSVLLRYLLLCGGGCALILVLWWVIFMQLINIGFLLPAVASAQACSEARETVAAVTAETFDSNQISDLCRWAVVQDGTVLQTNMTARQLKIALNDFHGGSGNLGYTQYQYDVKMADGSFCLLQYDYATPYADPALRDTLPDFQTCYFVLLAALILVWLGWQTHCTVRVFAAETACLHRAVDAIAAQQPERIDADGAHLREFSATLHAMQTMGRELTDSLQSQWRMEQQRAELEQAKADLEATQADLETQKTALDGKTNELAQNISQTDANISAADAEIEANKAALIEANKAVDKAAAELDAALNAANQAYGNASIQCSLDFGRPLATYKYVSCYFGGNGHRGTDYAAPGGTEIYAVSGGVVTAAAYHWSWGYYVQVYHGKDDNGNTYSTLYAHMNSAPVVSVGQPVEKGKILGYVGSTGNSTGNHLHLEMKVNNVLVNVMNYLS
mgnify:CR=1 FL=1